MKTIAFWLVLLTALGLAPVQAQPVCSSSFLNSVACQSQAVNPQLTDILAGTQATGPVRSNQSVKMSLSQILNLPGSTQYLPFSGGTLTGKLTAAASATGGSGFRLTPGVAPTSPANGDVWSTSTGLFVQANGATLGPLGSGGGVNTGAQYALGYYATAGNTLSSLAPVNNSVLVVSAGGVPSFSATLPSGLTIPGAAIQPTTVPNTGSLPTVTTANAGQVAFVANCLNGTETGTGGSGCNYIVNTAGSWTPQPLIPTQQITIGGQALYLGQATVNQGTGSKLQLATGSFVSGHALAFDANGTAIDAGVVPGGGSGGNGTVTAGTINQLAWYSSSGTAVAGLASINNGVLATNGSGIPAMATTLPSGLTLPSPTISNPALTGAGTYIAMTGTGKLTTAAGSTAQAGFNVTPGVAPTSPANGDVWSTTGGFFVRYNGGTFPVGSGNGTLTGITAVLPLTGTGTTGTLTLGCATCLTSTSGGAFGALAPLVFNSGTATLSLGNQTKSYTFYADPYTTVGNATYPVYPTFPYATGSITSINTQTGGSGSPSFTVGIQINGVNVATCNGLTVTTTKVTTTCGANAIVSGNSVTFGISGVNGTPSDAKVQIIYVTSAS